LLGDFTNNLVRQPAQHGTLSETNDKKRRKKKIVCSDLWKTIRDRVAICHPRSRNKKYQLFIWEMSNGPLAITEKPEHAKNGDGIPETDLMLFR
jgi:hypothetical protein